MIRSRLVLNFPGFEKTPAESQLDRIRHCANKTGEIWKFTCERKTLEAPQGARHMVSESLAAGPNWQVATRIVQFSWHDIINVYEGAPHPGAFLTNMPKYLSFLFDGTWFRYLRASQRYFYFTIFPLLLLGFFAAVSIFALWLLTGLFLAGTVKWVIILVDSALLVLLLAKWPGERLYLLLTINDWGFARDMVNRANPAIEARYGEFAKVLAAEMAASDHDEIIVSGHSFGSVWAVAALSLALQENPDLLKGRRVTFLAQGSSLLKIALSPGADWMRAHVRRVLAEPDLFWHEIQTKNDIIAFYKADPFKALGITGYAAKLRIDRPNYKKAMSKKRYRKMRRSHYETHRQYILYQDERVPFDYMLRLFGPLASRELGLDPSIIAKIDETGALV